MAIDLSLHGRRVDSVFELIGEKENDITYSIGWALAQSDKFRASVVRGILATDRSPETDEVLLQEYISAGGYTDIEIKGPKVHLIVEAKRGWNLPQLAQLEGYADRIDLNRRPLAAIVSMSEVSAAYANSHLPASIRGIPVKHMSWKDVRRRSKVKHGSHAEKRLLSELRTYLSRIVNMQNQESNLVFVVSLGAGRAEWSKLTWIEIATERRRYFHPLGNKWPKEPPNYIGFRYGGQLQSIHHIDAWEISTDLSKQMPELSPGEHDPHYIYTLGPPIVPPKTVKNGRVWASGHVWAMLDLLLTCQTVAEARDRTQKRQAEEK